VSPRTNLYRAVAESSVKWLKNVRLAKERDGTRRDGSMNTCGEVAKTEVCHELDRIAKPGAGLRLSLAERRDCANRFAAQD
jgi:hypothetical protein